MADVECEKKSSLVTDVLQKTGCLDKDEVWQSERESVQTTISEIIRQTEEAKTEVYNAIYKEYTYTDLYHTLSSTTDLKQRVDSLSQNYGAVSRKVKDVQEQLEAVNTEHSDITKQLKKTDAMIDVLSRLCQIHECLDAFPLEMVGEQYLSAAHHVDFVKKHLKQLPKAGQDAKIFIALTDEFHRQKTELTTKLERLWSKAIVWTTPTSASLDSVAVHLNTRLKIPVSKEAHMEEAMKAMQALGILDNKLKAFGKKLFDFVFKPLIVFPSLNPKLVTEKNFVILSFKQEKCKLNSIEEALYVKLRIVVEALKQYFQYSKNEDTEEILATLFSKLGEILWPLLSKNIIKDCLEISIPTTTSQLERYQEVITYTENFEQMLSQSGFIPPNADELSKYVKSVNIHMSNKKCQDLLVAARDLMKDDIHNTVEVGKYSDKAVLGNLATIEKVVELEKKTQKASVQMKMDAEKFVSESTFRLPTCRISESIKRLVTLAYETLIEATKSTPQCAVQLFYTVRNMFELFSVVVPTYHQESLTTLPQLAALHHNNCMYISHHLVTLGHQFRSKLPEPLNQHATTFADLVPVIRKLGENCFLEQLIRQRSQLLEIIGGMKGLGDVHEDERGAVVEKGIRQILHQLIRLGKVWKDILPVDICCQSLGALVDAVLQNLVEKVLLLEDISAEEASQLHSLLSIFVERIPEVFPSSDESSGNKAGHYLKYVTSWTKYKELIAVLEASLQDIVDRWTDGKGPLAAELSASEVRGLIRALFQNTDKRSAALNKIKQVQ